METVKKPPISKPWIAPQIRLRKHKDWPGLRAKTGKGKLKSEFKVEHEFGNVNTKQAFNMVKILQTATIATKERALVSADIQIQTSELDLRWKKMGWVRL